MATIRRNPMSAGTNSLNEKYMNFLEYKGLNTNKNYVSIDQETFTEVNNMYVNQDNQLSTRPPEEIFVMTEGWQAIRVWKINDKTFYHLKYVGASDASKGLTQNAYYLACPISWSTEGFQLYETAETIYLCWLNFAYCLFETDKITAIVYGQNKIDFYANDNAVYFPITKLHSGTEIYTVDSPDPAGRIILQQPNVLTNSYRERYLFEPTIVTGTSELEGNTVTVYIGDTAYTITWKKYNDKVFYKQIGTVINTNVSDYQAVSNASGLITLYLICDITSSIGTGDMNYYISLDANVWYAFTSPPKTSGGLLVISDDLKYIYCARLYCWKGYAYYKEIDLQNLHLLVTQDWTEVSFPCYINNAEPEYDKKNSVMIKLTLDGLTCGYQTGTNRFSKGSCTNGTAYFYLNTTVSVCNINSEGVPGTWYDNLPMYAVVIGNVTDGFVGTIFFTVRQSRKTSYTTFLGPAQNYYNNFIKGLFYQTNYRVSLALVQVEYTKGINKGQATIYNYLMYAGTDKKIKVTAHKSAQYGTQIITLNPNINDKEPEQFSAFALVNELGDTFYPYSSYVSIRYNKAINETEFIDVYSLSDDTVVNAEYTIKSTKIQEWTATSQSVSSTEQSTILPVQPVTNTFDVLKCIISPTKEILTSNSLYYNNQVIELLEPIDNPIYIGYRGNSFVWEAAKYGSTTKFYSNQYTETISVDNLVKGSIDYIMPEHSVDFITTCLSQGNVFYQSSKTLIDTDISEGKNLFYIPKNTKNDNIFTDKITALVNFSQTALGIFLETTAYQLTYDSSNDVYYLSKTKLALGNRDGSDMLLSYDGNNIYITTLKGLSTLNYQDFVQSTEQIYRYLTDAIMDAYQAYAKYPIKLCQYKEWLFLYHTNSAEVFVYDLRSSSWWKWTLPQCPKQLVYINDSKFTEDLVLVDEAGHLHKFRFDEVSVYDNELIPFDWSFTTQKMHFGAPNNYKHIRSVSIVTEQSGRPLRFKLKFTNYRNLNNLSDSDTVEYDIDQLTTMIKRVNFIKTNAFQLQVSNDKTDKYPQAFVTPNIAIKYRITERLR